MYLKNIWNTLKNTISECILTKYFETYLIMSLEWHNNIIEYMTDGKYITFRFGEPE